MDEYSQNNKHSNIQTYIIQALKIEDRAYKSM